MIILMSRYAGRHSYCLVRVGTFNHLRHSQQEKRNIHPNSREWHGNWPQDQKMNWSLAAKEHDIPGKNSGQIIKEFAIENGIEVQALDGIQRRSTRIRRRKKRMPGGEISVPSHMTESALRDEWRLMISKGELSLREPCSPSTIKRLTVQDGKVAQIESTVYGRKFTLLQTKNC